MAAGLPVPEHVFVHGFLLMDGEKMSKSLGNVLDPFAVIDRFGADALRFYLLRDVSFGQDGSVSAAAFEERYERELANDYGNLASRTLAMIERYRDGEVPAVAHDPQLDADFDGPGGAGRRADRLRRGDPGARRDLAARAAHEPLRRGTRAVEAGQGRGGRRRARRRAGVARRGDPRADRAAPSVAPGERPRSCSRRSAARRPATRLARLGAAPPTRVGPLEPLFPKQVPAEAAADPGASAS